MAPDTREAQSHTFDRSLAQRLDALEKANEIRRLRFQLKRDMKAERKTIQSVILNPPDYILTMKLFDLLLSAPRYGRVKVTKILNHTRISPSKTVGGLSSRQRREITDLLSL